MEVPFAEAAGFLVTGWRTVDGRLLLQVSGLPEERTVVCVCARRHWAVRTVLRETAAYLVIQCHACRRVREFPLAHGLPEP